MSNLIVVDFFLLHDTLFLKQVCPCWFLHGLMIGRRITRFKKTTLNKSQLDAACHSIMLHLCSKYISLCIYYPIILCFPYKHANYSGKMCSKTMPLNVHFICHPKIWFLSRRPAELPWNRHACSSWLLSWSATWLCVERRASPMRMTQTEWPSTTTFYREQRVSCCDPFWRRCRTRRVEAVRKNVCFEWILQTNKE